MNRSIYKIVRILGRDGQDKDQYRIGREVFLERVEKGKPAILPYRQYPEAGIDGVSYVNFQVLRTSPVKEIVTKTENKLIFSTITDVYYLEKIQEE